MFRTARALEVTGTRRKDLLTYRLAVAGRGLGSPWARAEGGGGAGLGKQETGADGRPSGQVLAEAQLLLG